MSEITAKTDPDEIDETDELRAALRAAMRKAFARAVDIPDDWQANTDVAVQLMEVAAEITIREELTMPGMGGGEPLFLEWAQRAYRRAQGTED